MYYPVLLLQPRDLENDTKSVHSYDEASLAAGQTYQVCNVDPLEHIYAWFIYRDWIIFSRMLWLECYVDFQAVDVPLLESVANLTKDADDSEEEDEFGYTKSREH